MIRALAIVLALVCAGCLREVDLTHGADAAWPDAEGGGLEPDAQLAPDAIGDAPGPLPDAGIVHD